MSLFFRILSNSRYRDMKAKVRELEVKRDTEKQILQHLDDIHVVMEKMGDMDSRVAYKAEIASLLIEKEASQALGFTMNFDEWEKQLKTINPAEYPDIEYPDENTPPEVTGHAFVHPQYEYEDRVCLAEGDVFLDCGACAGEVSLWAQRKVGTAGHVYAFEPSPRTFELLKRNLDKHAPDVLAFNYAIGEKNGAVKFSNEGQAWSRVDPTSSLTVPLICVDEFCDEFGVKPNLIKMDIEGYEPEALRGAARIIKTYRPDLAICVYHKASHMWEIGNLIQELCPAYTFYFKKHHPVWEAVIYATVR